MLNTKSADCFATQIIAILDEQNVESLSFGRLTPKTTSQPDEVSAKSSRD